METVHTGGKREEPQTTQPREHSTTTVAEHFTTTIAEHFTTTIAEHLYNKHRKALAVEQREEKRNVELEPAL